MTITKLKEQILEVLKTDDRVWAVGADDKKELNQTSLLSLVEKIDENIIQLLLEDDNIRDKFFVKIKDVYVFKTNDFVFFMEENKVNNMYTQYKNQIGLTDGKRFIDDSKDVVLNWPFKDCILEGGQSTEEGMDNYFQWQETTMKDKLDDKGNKIKDGRKNIKEVDVEGHYEQKQAKRKEIFFNEVIAADEIDRLEEPKALVNWKRYTAKGVEEVTEIKRDEGGTIKENLIIKGNNLLALHSLKKEFTGKVKLIYIDPPFNTGNDGFNYNDSFNHSTWLTFMKNRLEVAKKLLTDDGVIFIQCDDNQQAYLKVLMDEVFIGGYLQTVSVKKATTAGFKSINLCPITTKEYIFIYSKSKGATLNKVFVKAKYVNDYNTYITNIKEHPSKWIFISLNDLFLKDIKVDTWQEAKEKLGENWKSKREEFIERFANNNNESIISFKDLHKPSQAIKDLMNESKINREKVFIHHRVGQDDLYFKKGRSITFYKNKFRIIKGEIIPTEILSDMWTDIKWDGIAKEGGVELKNGKKPERLLDRILELGTNKDDIILDYHLGSGTTAAVAHKMGRQYIGIEQLDYGDNDSTARLQNVINGDSTGISKAVNWKGGGDFIYCELAKWNEAAKEKINECTSLDKLVELFDTLDDKYFLDYNLKIKEFKEKIILEDNFRNLSLEEQKSMFLTMLDLNQMYVNESEMEDTKYDLSEGDIALTKRFYNKED